MPSDVSTQNIQVSAMARRLASMEARYEQNRRQRAGSVAHFRRQIKKGTIVVALFALWIAGVADILSIVDAGWIISWAIPIVSWFLVRRITIIKRAAEGIANAHGKAEQQLVVLRQRLRPALLRSRNRMLLRTIRSEITYRMRSYVSTFVRDTIITQLLELIPVLDWLPMYLGQVAKVLVNQNTERQKALKLLPAFKHALDQLNQLEQFEIEYTATQIRDALKDSPPALSAREQREQLEAA